MINWTKTNASGPVDLTSYRPKLIVQCDSCSKEILLTIRVKSLIKNNQLEWYCPKCVALRQENRQAISTRMKQQWEIDDYKKSRQISSELLWNNEEFRIKHKESVQTEANRQKCSEAAKLAWENEQYRLAHSLALTREGRQKPNTEVKYDQLLNSLGIKFKSAIIGPYTFDYQIDRPGKRSLLIEINGNYWHTRPYVIRKDRAKVSYIANLEKYELRTIWEHQLADTDRILYLTKTWLGLTTAKREISLKDVEYRSCDIQQARDFLSNYHYLGSMGRAGIQIGGFIGDELICVAVLAHPTRKEMYDSIGMTKRNVLELTRFAIAADIHNKNLASHCLSRLPKFVGPDIKRLISFSDPSAGHLGTIYKAANWASNGETAVSYFYISGSGWKMHKKTLYNQANAMHLSESAFATEFGYTKIHTPPLLRFYYDLDN